MGDLFREKESVSNAFVASLFLRISWAIFSAKASVRVVVSRRKLSELFSVEDGRGPNRKKETVLTNCSLRMSWR